MKLNITALYIAIAESQMQTKEILARASVSPRTWVRACRGGPIRPQTAGRIARALGVPIKSLLANN